MLSHIDKRKLLCFDGLHYSFEILKYYYAGLNEACPSISADPTRVISAIASCWGFIDALHRIRDVAQSTPGVNSKGKEMRKFLDETELAEQFRHYIQHLRGELARTPPNATPVWGSLAWVDISDESKCHVAWLGAQMEGTKVCTCIYDTFEKVWVSKVTLSIGDHAFNFDPIYKSTMQFREFILPALVEAAPSEVKFHEKLPINTFQIGFIKSA